MRTICVMLAALMAYGCATQPPPTATYAATELPEATTLEQAQKLGYKLVDDNGRTLYCREWRKLGSHIQKERVCLTEAEFVEGRAQQQRTFDKMKSPGPIPYEGPALGPRGQ
jgi:hypothetical protein